MGKYSWLCKLQHPFITQTKKYKTEQCRLNLLDFFSNKRHSYLKIYLNRSIKFLVSIFRYSDFLCIDLYEFHFYCLRQLYNRSYLELLKFVSCMYQKKNFYRIILYITWQCVVVHDQPDKFWIEFSTIYGNSIVGSKTNHILLNMIPLKLAKKYFSILDRYTISQPELLKAIFEIATRKGKLLKAIVAVKFLNCLLGMNSYDAFTMIVCLIDIDIEQPNNIFIFKKAVVNFISRKLMRFYVSNMLGPCYEVVEF